ncbi:hypothetical protein [Cutibacterium avidum]|uniref:hypothetical protein n=1 Tax=Cutibacterium avidum TaxID=33010 RepID=UPI00080F8F78|nr:hypothetical protein [Cutibacterium avidum]OCK13488.1 hypothetical protein A9G02_11430 [Cutibacterium avidum]
MSDDFDISPTIEPNSDQLNADDLIAGPRTVTIHNVSKGSSEQPVNVELAEYPGRPWRPSKSMRRVLVAAWGTHSGGYVGQRVTLFRNPDIMFGRDRVGGIQVSHMSGIDKPLTVPLTVKRGKKAAFTVQPLPDAPAAPTMTQISRCTDLDQLRTWWQQADPRHRDLIKARVDDLQKPAEVVNEATGEVQDAFPEPAAPAAGADPWAEGGAK